MLRFGISRCIDLGYGDVISVQIGSERPILLLCDDRHFDPFGGSMHIPTLFLADKQIANSLPRKQYVVQYLLSAREHY